MRPGTEALSVPLPAKEDTKLALYVSKHTRRLYPEAGCSRPLELLSYGRYSMKGSL